jgi:sterol 3beta-glucosyltransferase
MLISILAAGSRGDVQPYIALGVELKKAGQRVRIVTFKNFESFVTGYGLEFAPVQGDITKIASSADLRHAGQADNPLKLLLSFKKLQALVFGLQKDFFEACQGSDAIVYHPGAAIGYFIAQHLRVPSILATPFPMTPTSAYPALIFYDTVRLGGAFNWTTHKIFEQIMWMASSAPIKQFWQQKFGHAPANFGSPYGKQTTSSLPTVTSCSDYVFAKPSDWPKHVYNTGYWFLPDDLTWQPSTELRDFLERGAPPVYVGFGSVGDPTQATQTTEMVINALKLAGQRGVLATGWSGMSKIENLPDDIFMLESAPHSWLFPCMAAVVHHGGAGTTAAGLSAGVPSVVIPFSNDQFAWARRVFELGVGSKPIRRKNLSAEKLAQAIQFALTQEVRDAAQKLGANIQSEDGAATAAKVILTALQ